MGDKQAAKLRRRENKELRDREKAERTGESPAQEAEKVRMDEKPDPASAERRAGTGEFVGGDTAP